MFTLESLGEDSYSAILKAPTLTKTTVTVAVSCWDTHWGRRNKFSCQGHSRHRVP